MDLRRVAEVVTGNTPSKRHPEYYGEGIPWAKPPDLDNWEPIAETDEFLTELGQKQARVLPRDSVLVCCIGSIGRVGIAGTRLATNQQINSLIFNESVYPRFGYYYFRYISEDLKRLARRAVVPIINKGNFQRIQIPLPPPSEQRRIVEILEQADALRRMRAKADAKAQRILPALFVKMFGDPVTNPMGWEKKQLGKYAKIVTGNTPSTKIESYYNGRHPWARPADLDNRIYVQETEKYLSDAGLRVARLVPENSVLVVCIGTIGKVAMAGQEMAINQQINAIFPNEKIYPEFLYVACTLIAGQFRSAASQSILPILNKSKFAQQAVICPDPRLQECFGRISRDIFGVLERATSTQDKIEQLFSTLLHRAFSGELTAKWREAHMAELLQEMEQQARLLNGEAERAAKEAGG